jgi:hypothetical protein
LRNSREPDTLQSVSLLWNIYVEGGHFPYRIHTSSLSEHLLFRGAYDLVQLVYYPTFGFISRSIHSAPKRSSGFVLLFKGCCSLPSAWASLDKGCIPISSFCDSSEDDTPPRKDSVPDQAFSSAEISSSLDEKKFSGEGA